MTWWKTGVVYQVYPRSFQDSDGDGVGDLRGAASRIDHLAWLGVNAIWLSPFYRSPMVDFGYDVSDHCAVDPMFGTLADFDELVRRAHAANLRVILDFVPNHTSDRHPWFVESRSSRTNPKRDWYLWRDEPNDWTSIFGGSAWEKDPATGQCYYHAYLKEQPDLNWRNPEVVRAQQDVLRFWMKRGVDGFRVDVIGHLAKDPSVAGHAGRFDRDEVGEPIARIRETLDEHGAVMIGEAYVPMARLMRYYGFGVDLPFNFSLITNPFEPKVVRGLIEEYERALPRGAWPNWVLGNHDMPRIATRSGGNAALAATLLLTLRGTPTLYQGDELGTPDVAIPPENLHDPLEKTRPGTGRDKCRVPMRWTKEGGFTTGEPWLPLPPIASVEEQRNDPDSILSVHRRLLALRRTEPALSEGDLQLLSGPPEVIAYDRGGRFGVALNFGPHRAQITFPSTGTIAFATERAREGERTKKNVLLAPGSAVAVRYDDFDRHEI